MLHIVYKNINPKVLSSIILRKVKITPIKKIKLI